MRPGLIILLLALATPVHAAPSHGVAVLVVNRDYVEMPVARHAVDVSPLARALQARGFTTTVMHNLGQNDLRPAIEQFAKKTPTHGVALIYFAGYLLPREGEAGGDISLLPVDYQAGDSSEFAPRYLGVRDVLDTFKNESGASIAVVLLEGSEPKSLPGKPTVSAAVAGIESPEKTFLRYAKQGLADQLTQRLSDQSINALPAILATAPEPPELVAVAIRPPIYPPEKVAEGGQAGDEWVNVLGTVFVWCPSRFDSSAGVRAPGFWLGKYEVTRREFDLVTRKKPKGALAFLPNHPRDAIRYDDILLYVSELNRRERFFNRLPENWEYALPTEAQWEYAARAGSTSRFYFGASLEQLSDHANYADRSLLETGDEYFNYADGNYDDANVTLAPVGSYEPNPWGFHDLYGNIWEWMGSNAGEEENGSPVARGCSWVSLPEYCDAGFVHRFSRDTERNFIGFRLALRARPY